MSQSASSNTSSVLLYVALALGAAALLVAGVTWMNQPDVGYVDSSRLMQEYQGAIDARKKIQDRQKQWQQNVGILQQEASGLEKALLNGQVAQSNVQAVRDTLRKKRQQLARYQQAVQKKSQEMQQEVMEPVFSTLNAEITDFGEERGFDIILGTLNGGNILYADDATDLTDELLAYLDDGASSKTMSAPAQPDSSASASSLGE